VAFLSKLKFKGIILDLDRANLRSLRDKKNSRYGKVVLALPVVMHDASVKRFLPILKDALNMGFRAFMVGNYGHIDMLYQVMSGRNRNLSRLEIYCGREMNLLNSMSVLAVKDMGVRFPQLSTETGRKNAEAVCRKVGRLCFTVMAWIPLFTSRAVPPGFRKVALVKSLRDEEYLWQTGQDVSFLLSMRPFSLLNRKKELLQAGFGSWIVDFSLLPANMKMPRKRPASVNGLSKIFHGSNFNFFDELE
jgi:collagenase-like PrtC family protease